MGHPGRKRQRQAIRPAYDIARFVMNVKEPGYWKTLAARRMIAVENRNFGRVALLGSMSPSCFAGSKCTCA